MVGPINSIFAAVTERLATIADYANAADWCRIGATNLAAADVPPRIVWVPFTEGYGPPVGQGGDGVRNPRPVLTRQSLIKAHIWAAAAPQTGQVNQNAADLDAAEALINAFAWAVYSVSHGAPPLQIAGQGQWTPANVDGQNLTLGVGYIMPLTFWIPVTRPLTVTARVSRITADIALPNSSTEIVIPNE